MRSEHRNTPSRGSMRVTTRTSSRRGRLHRSIHDSLRQEFRHGHHSPCITQMKKSKCSRSKVKNERVKNEKYRPRAASATSDYGYFRHPQRCRPTLKAYTYGSGTECQTPQRNTATSPREQKRESGKTGRKGKAEKRQALRQ